MSSGAYVIDIPVELIGMAIQSARETKERLEELDRQKKAVDAEYMRVREAADAVLGDIRSFRESLKHTNFQYSAETATFREREAGVSTTLTSTLDLSDLMFMEVDVQTQDVTYVVLDYSDTISVRNAKNSAQFKKMALASDLMKKVMVWVVPNPEEQQRLNQLIGVVNGMLDDDNIPFEHFRNFVELRFAAFHRQQQLLGYDPELWDRYCALCAMRGERPRQLPKEELAQEVERLTNQAVTDRFVANARKAFMEAVQELGLEVRSGHVLDRVSGTLLTDKENPAFSLFFSEHDVSFLLEMVENPEADSTEREKQQQNVCRKRRQLEQRMREKGYRLRVCAEDDDNCAKMTGVAEKKDQKETRAEQLRRRRALSGKAAKLKMAGGR